MTDIGLYYNPWKKDYSEGPLDRRTPIELYRKAVWFKANPRSADYMKELFKNNYPEGLFVDTNDNPDWIDSLSGKNNIILLYPDSTGLYFSGFEKSVFRRIAPGCEPVALNGRKRTFSLNRKTLSELRLRRFIERFMIGELIAVCGFMIITPAFVITDFLRGRR